jgi:putative membrane protein
MAVAVEELNPQTKLSIERTMLSHERTLMAWVRTSTSLISFGFTIYKFFQYLRDSQTAAPRGLIGPREFALMMITIGIVALALATLGHRRSLTALHAQYGVMVPPSLATTVSYLVGVFGVLLLLAAIFHQ